MNQGPVSCLPMNSKMSKVKKALDEAHELNARELDLVDKNVISFDEMPGLCEFLYRVKDHFHIWKKMKNDVCGRDFTVYLMFWIAQIVP